MIRSSSRRSGTREVRNATPPLIDHPDSQPIEYQILRGPPDQPRTKSGLYLRFHTRKPLLTGSQLLINIRVAGNEHRFHSQVIKVDRTASPCRVVVWIGRRGEAFAARMVEQLCHIAHYRLNAAKREGRKLSPEGAADEWISRFAARFPPLLS